MGLTEVDFSRALRLAALVAVLSGCPTVERTEIVLVLDTDAVVPDTVDEFVVRALGPSGDAREATADLSDGLLPRSVGLVHEGGPLGPFLLSAVARRDGEAVLARDARLTFLEGRTLTLTVVLPFACRHVACPRDETCGNEAECRPIEIAPSELERWRSSAPPPDAASDVPPPEGDAESADVAPDGPPADSATTG